MKKLMPEDVALVGGEVAIKWNDGTESYFPMEFLRAHSPSASTAGETDILGNVSGATDGREFSGVTVVGYKAVGGYALCFHFSDGHHTGIYSFDYLKKLAEKLES